MDPSPSPRSAADYEALSSSPSTAASDSPASDAQQQLLQPQPEPQQTVPSLTSEELDAVKRAVGSTASVLASAVAKLYLCPAGSPSFAWTGLWGACVLVVDRSRSNPSKHIQLWSLHPSSSAAAAATAAAAAAAGSTADSVPPTLDRTLSVQLYEGLDYLSLHPLFHAFEVDSGVLGLSFGHAAEAAEFAAKCREHVPALGSTPRAPVRKASLLQRISGIFSSASPSSAGASTPPPSGSPKDYSGPSSGSLSPLIGGTGSSSGGNSATASTGGGVGGGGGGNSVGGPSISPPQGFVHHAHAGFSPAGHFVPGGNLPSEWHGLFENAQQAIAIKNAARDRGNSQNSSSSSSTPGAAASAAASAATSAAPVRGSPASAHSEGSSPTSHPHQQQLSHHAAWTPTHNPNQSPRA